MNRPKTAHGFERFSTFISRAVGSSYAFGIAFGLIVVWLITGPFFDFSETWQLIINTGTTIITFLMVFLIQKSQNKDSLAIQLKLNELLAANELASNRMVNVEELTEEELAAIHKYYAKLNELSKKEGNIHKSHSIDEAEENHRYKHGRSKEEWRRTRRNTRNDQ
jgi:low affinity Fe/Cu permease